MIESPKEEAELRTPSAPGIAPADRVPLSTKIIGSSGGIVDAVVNHLSTNILWMPVFNLGFGISPWILGLILVVFRGWDALIDPIVGNFSDNTRTRFGRRRPFIVAGAVTCGLVLPWLWRPNAEWGQMGMAIYVTAVGLVLYTVFAFWAMPYYSLMLELTPDYDERTNLASFRAFFSKILGIGNGWVMALLTSSYFANQATGQPDIVHAVQKVSIFLAVLIVVVGVLPGLFIQERYYEKDSSLQRKEPFLKSLKDTFRLKPLWMLAGIAVFQLLGSVLISGLGQYINIFLISGGHVEKASYIEGWKATAMAAAGIASIPFWNWFCRFYEKRTALFVVLLSVFVGHTLNFFCLNASYPYLQLIPSVFYSAISGALWLIIPAMMADVADYDELITHRRREGSINAAFSWAIKMSITISVGLGGFVLEWTGFDVGRGAAQSPGVLRHMVLSYIFLPVGFWAATLLFLWKYPLTRQRMQEIRTMLEQRRGKV